MTETKRLRLAVGRPCIMCGGIRKHSEDAHARYRHGMKRYRNLLTSRAPKLDGLAKVRAFYKTEERPEPAPIEWRAKVLPSGEVIHVAITDPDEIENHIALCKLKEIA